MCIHTYSAIREYVCIHIGHPIGHMFVGRAVLYVSLTALLDAYMYARVCSPSSSSRYSRAIDESAFPVTKTTGADTT